MTKIAVFALFTVVMATTTATANATKGQKLYSKKLRNDCGLKGSDFAAKHTKAEWTKIMENGKMADEIRRLCPNAKDKALKEKYIKHYYEFNIMYSKDSGKIPAF